MNIHELSRRTGISLSNLGKLKRLGVLTVDEDDVELSQIKRSISVGQPLSVAMLFAILDRPSLLGDLGNFEQRAREQFEALGDVKAGAAPDLVNAYIADAAKGKPGATMLIAKWLREVVPVKPVAHAWVATRLLYNLPPHLRAQDMRSVNLALTHVRKLPDFAGYWHRVDGKIFYSQPNKYLDI